MPASKAQQKAVYKYTKANYDVFQIKMPKGKKEEIKAKAEKNGESLNALINRLINAELAKDEERCENGEH
ncbi:Arc family DNA-binding protein [Thomasclavelia cocleata]|uniref:Arc family DNA-binding protein n=1 Tax=Thomasclavelia cocleata TaxID=69824 RepID=UPI00272DA2CC|nr:Arc family DNA-binding protein [Thomasclavelia cocleata]